MNRTPRFYFDTNILVYMIEGFEPFASHIANLLDAIDRRCVQIVSSELTIAEALVKPLTGRNAKALAEYDQLFSSDSPLELVPVRRVVLERSSRLRAEHGGKLADAIHLATAELAECSYFVSADSRLKSSPALIAAGPRELPEILSRLNVAP